MTDGCSMWFSPTAVGDLRRRSYWAADELRQLLRRCADTQAASALRAALADLEFEVLPALERLCTSNVLTEWNQSVLDDGHGHRRPPPMTPARRASALLSIIDEPSSDDASVITAANSLARLIEQHPSATHALLNDDPSRPSERAGVPRATRVHLVLHLQTRLEDVERLERERAQRPRGRPAHERAPIVAAPTRPRASRRRRLGRRRLARRRRRRRRRRRARRHARAR